MAASQASDNSGGLGRFLRLCKALFKQHWGSILLYTGILFALYTLPTFLSFLDEYNFFYYGYGAGHNFSGFGFVMFVIYIMVVPICLGVKHFGYMHSKRAVDLYHALPVKRSELYLAETAVGSIVLAVPIIINFGLIMCLQVMAGFGRYVPDGLVSMFLWIVAGYVVFAITGFCAVNTGSTLDTALFTMALNGAPTAIFYLNQLVCDIMLYGFGYNDNAMIWGTRLSPIPTMLLRELSDRHTVASLNTNTTMVVWTILAVGITAGTVMLYKRRRSEMAEVVGNYGPAQVAIRAMIYYLGAILFALAFTGIFYEDNNHFFFTMGAAVGAFLTGIIGEMILTRSPRVTLKRLPITLGVVVVAVAGSFLYARGGFGYETYVPAPASVENVHISFDDGYQHMNGRRSNMNEYFDDPEVVEKITQVHAAQVEGYKESGYLKSYYGSTGTTDVYFTLTYNLKSGKIVSRRYYGAYDQTVEGLIELATSPGYVERRSEFFYIEPTDIGVITLANILQDNAEGLQLTPAQKDELLKAMQADLKARDGARMAAGINALGIIEVDVAYLVDDEWPSTVYEMDRGTVMIEQGDMSEDYRRNQYTLSFQIYEGDDNTLRFLEKNDLMHYIEADFSRVTDLWVIDNIRNYYYYGGIIGTLNTNMGEEVAYTIDAYLEYMHQDDDRYYHEVVLPVDVSRIDELRAKASATTSKMEKDMLILAFRTDTSLRRTGFLYIKRSDLPADIAQALLEMGDYTYSSRYESEVTLWSPSDDGASDMPEPVESSEPEEPAQPTESVAPKAESATMAIVPVGTLKIRY